MLVAAAVCPHPPALVPEVASGAADELAEVRRACLRAVDAIALTAPEVTIVVGVGERSADYPPGSEGTLAPYGVDIRASLPGHRPTATEGVTMPLSLTVGGWLLGLAGWSAPVHGITVPPDLAPDECARRGAEAALLADRVAMVVMADGSAARTESAPRPYDDSAAELDATIVAALRAGDPAALLQLDPGRAAAVHAAGRAPLQVLAGAAGEAVLDAVVEFDGAPYGVGYVVAVLERHG